MQDACRVAVDSNFLEPAPDNTASAGGYRSLIDILPARQLGDVLLRYVQIEFRVLARGFQGLTRRIVQLCPFCLSAIRQVANQHTGDRSVSGAVSGVSGHY